MKERKIKSNKRSSVKSGSIKVDPLVLEEAKSICKEKGILLTFFCTEAIREKINTYRSKSFFNT